MDLCQAALRLDETSYLAYRVMAKAYFEQGRFEEAVAACAQAKALTGDSPVERGLLAATHWRTGRREEARRLLAELGDMTRHGYVQASIVGKVYLVLGELEEGWNWVERAVEERDPDILTLAVDPFFDHLRQAERYNDLLRRMHLERRGGEVSY